MENLEIIDIDFFDNHETKLSGMVISWRSDKGWGEYIIHRNIHGNFWANTEYMDHGEDKEFGRKLLELLMNKVVIQN